MLLTLLLAALAQDPAVAVDGADPVEAPLSETDPSSADPFLWLEEVEGEAALAQVRRWNAATDVILEADPRLATLEAEAREVLLSEARIPEVGMRGTFLYNHWRDATRTRGVWRRIPTKAWLQGSTAWEELLDLDALAAAEGENWVWHRAYCAPASPRCLVELSRGGSDAAVLREFDLDARAFVPGGFEVPEAKSSAVLWDEDTVLIGTDRGPDTLTESGYPRTIARWTRGQPLAEAPLVFTAEPTDVSADAWVFEHRGQRVALVGRSPSFFELELHRLTDDGALVALPLPRRVWPIGLFDGALLVQVHEPWTVDTGAVPAGSLIALDLERLEASLVFAPSASQSLEQVSIGRKTLTLAVLDDVVGQVLRLRRSGAGWAVSRAPLPDHGAVSIAASDEGTDAVLVSFESLTVPTTLYHLDKRDRARPIQSLPPLYDASEVVVEQRFATSADGTRVPYFLMARRDVLAAGPAPTIQYGYGGFLSAILPSYFSEEARPQHGAVAGKLWVSRGGVLVLSNLRGGSEYGSAWHEAALGPNRDRAFEDFFAIGEELVASGVTTPAQLGAMGRSNGGLLMGVAMTRRPDLYRAIDCGVPLLDMLRYDKLLAGASWVGEYGDPDLPDERAVLAAYSPYQALREGVDYPDVLLYTSTRDDRVHPGHARKFAARLEQLGQRFYYWENIEGGHGGVANQDQAARRLAIEILYFTRELGLGGG